MNNIFAACMIATHMILVGFSDPSFEATSDEINLMARVVMSEASLLNDDGKQAIAQVILNRIRSDKFPDTVEEVVHQENQFSTSYNGEPTEACYEAVEWALEYPDAFPTDMYYFRTNNYHSFGKPYCHIGNTYFSTIEDHNGGAE